MTDEKDYKPKPCIFRGGDREATGDDDLCYLTENKCLLVFGSEYSDDCRAPDMIQFEVERRTKELSEQLDSAVLHVAKLCAEAGSATAETVWGESESKKRISALEAEVESWKEKTIKSERFGKGKYVELSIKNENLERENDRLRKGYEGKDLEVALLKEKLEDIEPGSILNIPIHIKARQGLPLDGNEAETLISEFDCEEEKNAQLRVELERLKAIEKDYNIWYPALMDMQRELALYRVASESYKEVKESILGKKEG